jgi:hypothetical protein
MEKLTLLRSAARGLHTRAGTLLLAAGMLLASSAGAVAEPLEYAVKATYLYKFGFFVQWPAEAFAATNTVNLCVLGDDPFGGTLDTAVKGQRIADRPIAVKRMKTITNGSGCHILYITGDSTQALEAVKGRSVLTVTDGHKTTAPGIINFVIKDNRVRFSIDDAAAAQNNLTISSKLLSLAVSVKPRH